MSAGTAEEQLRTDNGYLSVAGIGGAGQFFVVNQQSKFQIATCTAVKSSRWSAFGVTYYDESWNEVGVQRKRIFADVQFNDPETRYAIGLAVPDDAVFAYLWVWNDDSTGYVQMDDFRVVNYFPEGNASFDGTESPGNQYTQTFPAGRNLIINGAFETFAFEADEFWVDSTGFGARKPNEFEPYVGLGLGNAKVLSLISQEVRDIQPGNEYTLTIRGGLESSLVAVVGIDFLDADGNEIDEVFQAVTDTWQLDGPEPGPGLQTLDFTMPIDAQKAVIWVWVPKTGSGSANLWLNELSVTTR